MKPFLFKLVPPRTDFAFTVAEDLAAAEAPTTPDQTASSQFAVGLVYR